MKPSVSILVPLYNEEDVLQTFYSEMNETLDQISDYDFEFLFIDDGSTDATLSILHQISANDPRVSFISLSRNFGKERAMLAGFDAVVTDAVVIIDADLQDPPGLIPAMLSEWEAGYEDVYAKRRTREGESFLKRVTSNYYYRVLQRTTRIAIQKDTGDFRLLDRKCIDALIQFRESERYTKGMFSWIGFKKKELLYDRAPRAAGRTKWNYGGLANLAIDGITSFTTVPLRFSTFLGLIVSTVAFIYLILLVIGTVFWGNDLAGYPSMMAVILFLGGVQLLSLGTIGEYVGRIFNETKGRPVYIVQSEQRGRAG